jgi:hypothetical protein
MTIPNPDLLFDRLGLPQVPVWGWRTGAGVGLAGSAVAVALHHPWPGGILLLAGCLAAGAGEALARREGKPAVPILPLGLLAIPFGFALAEPDRALAAMFAMFALTVLTILDKAHVSVVTWLTAAGFLAACIFPDRFSLLAYTIGVIAFIAAGQGAAKGWA